MNRVDRRLKDFLSELAGYDYLPAPIPAAMSARAAGLMVDLWPARKPVRKVIPLGRMKPTKKDRNKIMAHVRMWVWDRVSDGTSIAKCECGCGRVIWKDTFHMDHFLGGSKRTEETTVVGCWALHPDCDAEKTAATDRRPWLCRYGDHLTRHGYTEQLRKLDGIVALYEAQRTARSGR